MSGSDLKIKIEKLMGGSNWAKWKWQMNMHFVQHNLQSIIEGTRTCPSIDLASSTEEKKKVEEWNRDNAKASALIASSLSQSVADLVLTYTNAKDIWDKLVSVFEQSNIQRLSLLMTEFFNITRDPEVDIAGHVAKVEKLFSDMNCELRRRGSHDIPIELLHGQILATVGPEYQEFNNVWESLDDNKRTTNILLEKLCTIEKRLQSTSLNSSSSTGNTAFGAHGGLTKQNVSRNNGGNKFQNSGKSNNTLKCYYCGKIGHIKRNCFKFKNDTDKNDNKSFHGNNDGSAFSAWCHVKSADTWECDSGASHHMTANKQYFVTYTKFIALINISLANNEKLHAYGCGRINVQMFVNDMWSENYLENIWYVPDIGRHLFSVRSTTNHGITVFMNHDQIKFNRDGKQVATGEWLFDSYIMHMRVVLPKEPASINMATYSETLQIWHERLGHQNKRHVRSILAKNGINVSITDTKVFCDGCALGKAHRKPFKFRSNRAAITGEQINADVNGPMSIESIQGANYYVSFKDDFSKYRRIFFIKRKNEVSQCLNTFIKEACVAGHTIKKFRCDGGNEFDCGEVRQILNSFGIILELTAPYSPEQNGAAEQENRTVVDLARSMLSVSELPKMLWAEACKTAVYILNLTGRTPVEGKSPLKLRRDHEISKINHLRVFGCDCYVYVPKQFRKKFDNKSIPGKMVGYLNDKDGYQVYVPTVRKIINSHDVYFKPEKLCTQVSSEPSLDREEVTLTKLTANKEDELLDNEEDESTSYDSDVLEAITDQDYTNKQRPKRNLKQPKWMNSGDFVLSSANSALIELQDPVTYKDALNSKLRRKC